MKKRRRILALIVTGLIAILAMVHVFVSSSVKPRAVRLVIPGPAGQRFSGI